jgi:hypothetical protein
MVFMGDNDVSGCRSGAPRLGGFSFLFPWRFLYFGESLSQWRFHDKGLNSQYYCQCVRC